MVYGEVSDIYAQRDSRLVSARMNDVIGYICQLETWPQHERINIPCNKIRVYNACQNKLLCRWLDPRSERKHWKFDLLATELHVLMWIFSGPCKEPILSCQNQFNCWSKPTHIISWMMHFFLLINTVMVIWSQEICLDGNTFFFIITSFLWYKSG